MCVAAAENGHLETLKWAREISGCPWGEAALYYATSIDNGHFEILKWARHNGSPWSGSICE